MREIVRSEIASVDPLDTMEREHITEALAWIDSGAELCRRIKPATPPKHLVSYFAVIDGEQILLVDHKNAQLWLPPGGHVEPDEHPRTTVHRELREELGIAPDHEIQAPLMVTCTTTVGLSAGHTDVSLWYVVHVSRTQHLKFGENEFDSICWFPWNEVPLERSDPHLGRFMAKLSKVGPGFAGRLRGSFAQ